MPSNDVVRADSFQRTTIICLTIIFVILTITIGLLVRLRSRQIKERLRHAQEGRKESSGIHTFSPGVGAASISLSEDKECGPNAMTNASQRGFRERDRSPPTPSTCEAPTSGRQIPAQGDVRREDKACAYGGDFVLTLENPPGEDRSSRLGTYESTCSKTDSHVAPPSYDDSQSV